jgi:hypothetical protein
MRRLTLFLSLALVGCQELQVRNKVTNLVRNTPDIYQQQILDNLARQAAVPSSMPYFVIPTQGTAQIAKTGQVSYQQGIDFITSGQYVGRYLWDKVQPTVQVTKQVQETWQTGPVNDPDKLMLIRVALHKALGIIDPNLPILEAFYTSRGNNWAHYEAMVRPGWLCIGTRKDVPRDACFVGYYTGCCGDVYVWTTAGHEGDLADLTFAILDIATLDEHAFAKQYTPPSTGGVKVPKDRVSDGGMKSTFSNNAAFEPIVGALEQHIIGRTFSSEASLINEIDAQLKRVAPKMPQELATEIKKYLLDRVERETVAPGPPAILSPRSTPYLPVPPPPSSSP